MFHLRHIWSSTGTPKRKHWAGGWGHRSLPRIERWTIRKEVEADVTETGRTFLSKGWKGMVWGAGGKELEVVMKPIIPEFQVRMVNDVKDWGEVKIRTGKCPPSLAIMWPGSLGTLGRVEARWKLSEAGMAGKEQMFQSLRRNSDPRYDVDEPWKHAKWRKPDMKGQAVCVL